jgi:hypothetical protein
MLFKTCGSNGGFTRQKVPFSGSFLEVMGGFELIFLPCLHHPEHHPEHHPDAIWPFYSLFEDRLNTG